MARYFFHLYNDLTAMDEEGRECPDLASARENAVREAREIMLDTLLAGRIDLSHRIDIADETGAVVASVAFRDVVAIEG
jgi:hypothetical protein